MDKVDPSDFQPSTQNINGSAGGVIILTPESDTKQVYMVIPPSLAIPIVFLPGVMGSNLRMTKSRQEKLKRKDNRAWRPDDAGDTLVRRHDDPDIRQLNFDPDETEVEYYEWTADGKRFDATQADDTVPADKSARQVKGKTFIQRGYEHQDSYKDHDVQAATLYSVAKIASQAIRDAYERKTS